MSTLRSSPLVRVEHVLNQLGDGAVASLPIVVSDSKALLRAFLDGVGLDTRAPVQWSLCVRDEPLSAWQETFFNRAVGWRLREQLRALVGSRWRWYTADRTREFGGVSGSAGRADIPIDRLWLARSPDIPGPMQTEWLHDWGDTNSFGSFNDGLIAIDVLHVRGLIASHDQQPIADLVAMLLRLPSFWNHVGAGKGRFDIRIRGDVADLLDDPCTVSVCWRARRRNAHIADVVCARATKWETNT